MIDLTVYAHQGYDGVEPALTHGSSAFLAWRVGQWLRQCGGVRPTRVTSEVGYAVRVDDVKVIVPAGATGTPRIVGD